MPLKVSESRPYVTNIPEDTHNAVCVGVFDLGTVKNEKFGNEAPNILFLWELVDLKNPEGHSETIRQQFTASLGEKSNLRRMLTNWRGKPFTEAELKEFDVKAVLGKACQILVIHNESKGNTYANIQNVSGWPKGVPAPKPTLPLLTFEFGVHTEIPYGTPDWIDAKIISAPEWNNRHALAGQTEETEQANAGAGFDPVVPDDDESGVPF